MNRQSLLLIVALIALAELAAPDPLLAYAGPGAVLTAIGALLALFVALVASIAGFLWYPLKRLRSAWRARRSGDASARAGGGQ